MEVAGIDSVAVVEASRTVDDCTSCSDEATEEDRHSIVVIGTVKAARAYCGGGVGIPMSAL
jgi:hypothetical protein